MGTKTALKINKRVTGTDTIRINGTVYNCYKIEWRYDLDSNQIWDENIKCLDYVCAKGLLKRTYTFKDMVVSTIYDPNGIGKADVKVETIVTGINF